jgi:hypothetical protein
MNTPGTIAKAFLAATLVAARFAGAADAPAAATPAAAAPTEAAHWQKVPLDFSYSGFTTLYSCYGIEDKVKTLLKALGARGDARVVATGCEDGPHMHVSKFAFVRGEFYALAPGAGATAEDTVQAQWQPVEISANRPFTVGEGDCELVEQMKPVIEKAFALRESTYSTRCVPNSVSPNSFNVKAKALKVPKG